MLGVLLYAMLVGSFPFIGVTKAELSRHILRGHFTTSSHVSREPKSLLRSMMLVDPPARHDRAECAPADGSTRQARRRLASSINAKASRTRRC